MQNLKSTPDNLKQIFKAFGTENRRWVPLTANQKIQFFPLPELHETQFKKTVELWGREWL